VVVLENTINQVLEKKAVEESSDPILVLEKVQEKTPLFKKIISSISFICRYLVTA
jgi:hypothetical protein